MRHPARKLTASGERLQRLQAAVDRLAHAVGALQARMAPAEEETVRAALRRRGLTWSKTLHEGCILPPAVHAQEEYYQLLRHYSFRLLLRDVVKHRQCFSLADLTRYCSPASARRYLDWLLEQAIVRRQGKSFRLAMEASSFGPTLEWFVAAVMRRDYGIPSAWGVRLDAAGSGGDYDVIGFQDGACIYVETKSSPPRNIDTTQVRAFLDRLYTLRPDLAVFLNDTSLHMADKIVVLFRAELRRRLGRQARGLQVQSLGGELYRIGDHVCIANSVPDLAANLGACLAQYFRRPPLPLSGSS